MAFVVWSIPAIDWSMATVSWSMATVFSKLFHSHYQLSPSYTERVGAFSRFYVILQSDAIDLPDNFIVECEMLEANGAKILEKIGTV